MQLLPLGWEWPYLPVPLIAGTACDSLCIAEGIELGKQRGSPLLPRLHDHRAPPLQWRPTPRHLHLGFRLEGQRRLRACFDVD